jgi:hypothetical protein
MSESVQVKGGSVGSTAEETEVSGGCCSAPTTVAVVEPVAASPCCGTSAQAEAESSCCGTSAKAEAVASGASCCG